MNRAPGRPPRDLHLAGRITAGALAVGLLLGALQVVLAQEPRDPPRDDPAMLSEEIEQIRNELSLIRRDLQSRLKALEQRLKALNKRLGKRTQATAEKTGKGDKERVDGETEGSSPAAEAEMVEAPDGPLRVCREGCPFSDLNKAIEAAPSGAVVYVSPGLSGTCGVIDKPLRLIGSDDVSGKRAHLAGAACLGKAPLVIKASGVLIEGFEISNVTVPDKNGACLRIDSDAGDVTIRDLYCHDSENGILGGPEKGIITIEDSLFERNGANKGHAHGIYINRGDALIVRNSRILSSKGQGHTLKSGAKRTVVENSVLAALEGHNSRAIDAYGGGEVIVRRSVIQQGKNSDNYEAFGIALEPRRINPEPHSTTLEDNWILFDDPIRCCRRLFFAKQYGPIALRGNFVVGMTQVSETPLDVTEDRNRFFASRAETGLPAYDGTLKSLPAPGSLP